MQFLWLSTPDFLLIIIMISGNGASTAFFSLFYCSCFFARQKDLPHKYCFSFSLAILNLPFSQFIGLVLVCAGVAVAASCFCYYSVVRCWTSSYTLVSYSNFVFLLLFSLYSIL
ncbi:unnamed protein product [Coffea canephora]|uniref:Uncharacterized protein n=1 Tax=Coffea canephora TaxID=49390 RepID=A0A068UZY5_COFCA|nr:unnamed protein product [Coffea canephora]